MDYSSCYLSKVSRFADCRLLRAQLKFTAKVIASGLYGPATALHYVDFPLRTGNTYLFDVFVSDRARRRVASALAITEVATVKLATPRDDLNDAIPF